MKPGIEEARAIFEEEHPGEDWNVFVAGFRQPHAEFINDGEKCLMAIAYSQCRRIQCDTWFVWYASGPINELMSEVMPLPYVAWYRRKTKTLAFYKWDRIRALTMKGALK